MNNTKKYTAPAAEIVAMGACDIICTSVNSTPASKDYDVLSKEVPEWVFEEEE